MLITFSFSQSIHPQVQPTDEDLARQAQRKPELFSPLYERHVARVYHFCLARTGSEPDAQDLTSEIFLSALENLAKYDNRRSFAGWLFGIAHHKVADYYRRRRLITPLDDTTDLPDPDNRTEDDAEHEIQMKTVARAIQTLGSEQAEALTLRIFAGLSAAEAGSIMGKSEAAVKMLVHRAIGNLQNRLAREIEMTL